jgi:putative salt-induced outer membrane protein YdiY
VSGRCFPQRVMQASAILALASCLLVPPVLSADPADKGLGIGWWFRADAVDKEEEFSAPHGGNESTELWWSRNWGVRKAHHPYRLGEAGIDASEHLSIDFKRRFFSLTNNSFVALGAGWQAIDLESGESSSGLRLTAEGRFELGDEVSVYGQTSWLPDLDGFGSHSRLEGQEFEAGLIYDPAPSISLKLGFRRFRLGYEHEGIPGSAESEGIILGAGYRW